MTAGFVHLHVHSEYSLADGIVRLAPLAATSARLGLPAVALTDRANVHGVIKFYRACAAAGVKPLVGCDLWVENPLAAATADRMILLCRNRRGYRNLCKMLTGAYLRRRKERAVIAWADLEALHDHLLVLFDDHEGPLTAAPGRDVERVAGPLLDKYQGLFGDRLYFQVSRVGHAGEQDYIGRAARLAASRDIGLVATNRVQFIADEEFEAHEIRVCIHDGRVLQDSRRPRRFTPRQYLKSADQMAELFADLPEAVHNTVEIARRCNLFFDFEQNHLPDYAAADADDADGSVDEMLRRQAEQGLCRRLGVERLRGEDGAAPVGADYLARLELELGVISKMGYPGYFLIVADFIRWAKTNDIPVGPGRGSGAGSLVAWATGITELDPLRYGLLFERFLNPERVSLPDFDIDFCVDGRDRVIEYVAERYGREQVAQIVTFGTLAAKAVVRDVGRVMGQPYGFVDQIAKLIPFEIGMTLKSALAQEDLLNRRYQEESDVRELIDNAMQLEGIARNVSTHAGGVVIAPRALSEYTPLYADAQPDQAVTQLDKDDLEAIGLVKFDFLGLRTLTIIDGAVKMINRREGRDNAPQLDMEAVPLDDPETFRLLQSGRTTALFQIESRGIRELITRLKPDKFDDLVALVALYRPGPLQSGMVDDFINRKHGRETITYPHDEVAPILESTYGVILYQEQVMQIAQVLAGYTLGGSDLLRAAMGKKLVDKMDKQREVFRAGAEQRGVEPRVAERIFNLMEKFAGYGFNKSHSVAYALVAYHTAWLKAHHPAAYMAATLSTELNSTDKVVFLLSDCKQLGLEVLPPDVNTCYHGFRPVDQRTILYGMGAVKGVGKNVCEVVVTERERNGPFGDLFDVCRRLNARIVTKRVLEALIKCGAMDQLGAHRAALMADIDRALQAAEQQLTSQQTGQEDMFGMEDAPAARRPGRDVAPWSEQQRLTAEKETLGLYLTGHPYTQYRAELDGVAWTDLHALDLNTPKNGIFAGLVFSIRANNTRRGKMGFVVLDNASERVEVILYSEKYTRYRSLLQKDNVLVVYGEFGIDEPTGHVQMRAETVTDLDAFRRDHLRHVHVHLAEERLDGDALNTIHGALQTARGGSTGITIHYRRNKGESGCIKLPPEWAVQPSRQLIATLTGLVGGDHLRFVYDTASLANVAAPKFPR